MGSLPRTSVASGVRTPVPAVSLLKHLARLADCDSPALVYDDDAIKTCVTFCELAAQTNSLAKVVATRARPQGRNRDGDYVIAVCMKPTHKTVLSLLAVWKAGAAYVPMEPSFPQARVTRILKDAQPALVIYDESANPDMFIGSGVPFVSFDDLTIEASSFSDDNLRRDEQLSNIGANSIAIVLYTSGSTGIPKGVRIPFSAINNRLWWQFRRFPYSNTENMCVWKTALTFVDSVCEIWGPLLQGRCLLILSKETTRDPQKLVRTLAENQIERLVLVPTLLRSMLMYLSMNPSERPLKRLKLWVCSGETLSKELVMQFFDYFGDHGEYRLANFYGSTEVMGDVTYYVMESKKQLDRHSTIPIGMCVDNCAVYLLDDKMSPVREGSTGEVWVSGANLAAGYVGGQAPEKFCDNPHATHPDYTKLYRTGDYGVMQKGVILFAGRTDSQVKIRGHRVDLHEVERAVASVAGVEKCVSLCYGLERGNPEILAFVTIEPDARLTASNIEMTLKNSLTQYMIPQVLIIEKFPLLVNGKVDRQALLKIYENTNNNDDTEIPLEFNYTGVPVEQLDTAKVLFETVGEVLGRAIRGVVSCGTGFFELGGNSLNSIYTITRLREKGYFVDISDFLRASTLGEALSYMTTDPERKADGDEYTFTAGPMEDKHKQQVIDMTVASFYEKAELEQFIKHEIHPRDYAKFIDECWSAMLKAGLSLVLYDALGTPVAVALNFDVRDEPDVELSGGLAKIMLFLEYLEGPFRDTVLPPEKGAIVHSSMMATAEWLSPSENVAAIRALEHATMRTALDAGFKGVFTTNTSPLTQQLSTGILGYKTLLDYQINQYVDANGDRLFEKAPDDMRAIVCLKTID